MTGHSCHTFKAARRGFTLIEATVCTIVVGLMLAAALNASGAATARKRHNEDRTTGLWLAQSLMVEVIEKPYSDVGGLLGLELGESQAQRSTLNDIDDYGGLLEQPPRNPDGSIIPGYTHWSRAVTVEWVPVTNLKSKSNAETTIRRIIVTVRKNRKLVCELRAIRSRARDSW
jgi:prepilin-type N-terminal cleavage/methylation domain-containing protein